ncbi:acyl-[acyl-carrier-protein] thioesterase [Desulfoluna spongiiphila]|uniref:Medium-chain acyl-[acyl-carrier-protein] hydrolase n=1 Tax=Desulfoluna spongiiphila TaxID=419481 RepID=A0A1G5GW25_9BACT|nr:acyl-ACP thioesterase domain-containing protein [Desulfoluna spongiiphila]SCY54838.1 medium-chain acyl-[acyl-carrier-protein] hydrolase [Desulfoluna spongiiphila]
MTDIFTRKLKVRLSEVDPRALLKVQSLFDWFQDGGCEHAAQLGMSAAELLAQNYTWVLLKYQVRILRYPVWNEEVTLTSWRSPLNDLYDLREFRVTDAWGETLITGNSAWVVMDYTTRKPTRLSRCLSAEQRSGGGAIPDSFERILPVKAPDHTTDFRVRISDLDFNRHVNNSIYIGWALEALPESFLGHHLPTRLEVRFIREIARGRAVVSEAQVDETEDNAFLHRISGKDGEGELMRMRTVWQPMDAFELPEKLRSLC